MPGYLLHEGATVTCIPGSGSARPTVSSLRVKVGGQAIVTQAHPYQVTACKPPQGPPCATAPTPQWIAAAVKVKSEGSPVILSTSQAVCAPAPHKLQIVITQQRVKGI